MSKVHSLIGRAAVIAAISIAATPSFGQEKYHGRQAPSGQGQGQGSGQQSSDQSRERAQRRSDAPARAEAPRQQAEAPRPQAVAPSIQQQQAVPRGEPRRSDNNRANDYRPNQQGYANQGHAVPRGNVYAPH